MQILLAAMVVVASAAAPPLPADIRNNDNVKPAGHADGATLTLHLVADVGRWRPMGMDGPAFDVAAFGEEGGTLSVPGPLVRTREGTVVEVSLRNALDSELRVFGLCDKPGACEPLTVGPGATREVRFTVKAPGTFHYWGSLATSSLTARPRAETQLVGAIVVDSHEGRADDRVLVMSMYTDGPALGTCLSDGTDAVFAINGASWPHTTRFKYDAGETVRWRVVNLTCEQHAMHLHGFHFTVLSTGNGTQERPLSPAEQRTGVTEAIQPGGTFTMAWVPTRPGHWLFHCHMVPHMSVVPNAMFAHVASADAAGMAGLVIGVDVEGPGGGVPPPGPARRLSLVLREDPNRYGATTTGYRMDLEGTDAPRLDEGPVPGPILILHRGEPVEITVVNRMTVATAMHWHGMELESYYDGVPGFGGAGRSIAPPIAPGESFVVRFTPPRSGTFIYHTHWHDQAQLAGGLYGAMLVLEPGQQFDPSIDHVAVIALNGVIVPGAREPFALNGRATPAPIMLRAGVRHRLRLINITSTNVGLVVFLNDSSGATQWTPLAKDGAELPTERRQPRPARQPLAVGETYDFEISAPEPQNLWLEVRRSSGEWILQAPVRIR